MVSETRPTAVNLFWALERMSAVFNKNKLNIAMLKKEMVKEFDRNMFIMLLAIMIGVVIITYFAADIMKNIEMSKKEKRQMGGLFEDQLVDLIKSGTILWVE